MSSPTATARGSTLAAICQQSHHLLRHGAAVALRCCATRCRGCSRHAPTASVACMADPSPTGATCYVATAAPEASPCGRGIGEPTSSDSSRSSQASTRSCRRATKLPRPLLPDAQVSRARAPRHSRGSISAPHSVRTTTGRAREPGVPCCALWRRNWAQADFSTWSQFTRSGMRRWHFSTPHCLLRLAAAGPSSHARAAPTRASDAKRCSSRRSAPRWSRRNAIRR